MIGSLPEATAALLEHSAHVRSARRGMRRLGGAAGAASGASGPNIVCTVIGADMSAEIYQRFFTRTDRSTGAMNPNELGMVQVGQQGALEQRMAQVGYDPGVMGRNFYNDPMHGSVGSYDRVYAAIAWAMAQTSRAQAGVWESVNTQRAYGKLPLTGRI